MYIFDTDNLRCDTGLIGKSDRSSDGLPPNN